MTEFETCAAQANHHHEQAVRCAYQALLHIRQAGAALNEAKRMVLAKKEKWMPWVAAHFAASHETANLYMRIANDWDLLRDEFARKPTLSLSAAISILRQLDRPDRAPMSPANRHSHHKGPVANFEQTRKHVAAMLANKIIGCLDSETFWELNDHLYALEVKAVQREVNQATRITLFAVQWDQHQGDPWCEDVVDVAEEMIAASQ